MNAVAVPDSDRPLISFVGYTRNDGYVQHFERRLLLTTNALADQAQRFEVFVEFLIVEWNPPKGRPPIASLLPSANGNLFFSLRVVTVPPQFHANFRGANEKGLHSVRALNVGYRRSRGKFITPLASDVILSDSIFSYISQHGLNEKYVYRADRIDVDEAILEKLDIGVQKRPSLEVKLKAAQQHHNLPLDDDMVFHYGVLPLHTNASGDFLLMRRTMWHALYGQPEKYGVACLDADSIALHAAVASGLTEKRLPVDCKVYKLAHRKMCRLRVQPHRPWFRYRLEKFINVVFVNRPLRALVRGTFDVPRRSVDGLQGDFASFERNFVLKARWWNWRKKQVRLSGKDWGLARVELPEKYL